MAITIAELVPLIQVFDMPRALAFYCRVLGFQISKQSAEGDTFDWALLQLGGSALMLNTMYEAGDRPPAPDPARVTAHGDTTFYIACTDLDALHAQLRARGLEIAPPAVRPYGMKQLELVDPDGYLICFQHPAT